MRLKILTKLRTASLNSKFTASYKKVNHTKKKTVLKTYYHLCLVNNGIKKRHRYKWN